MSCATPAFCAFSVPLAGMLSREEVIDFLTATFTVMQRLGQYRAGVPPRMLATATAASAFQLVRGGGMTLSQFCAWFGL